MEREQAALVEGEVVVQLQRLPGRARLGEAVRVAGGVERNDRHLVAADVVRVRVAAVLVVGRHDVRPLLADHAHQRLDLLLEVAEGEAAVRQRRQRVALGQPGVDEAEEDLAHAEDLAGPLHLRGTDRRDVSQHLGTVHGGVQHRPPGAVGERDDEDVDTLPRVAGHRGRALAGLVVRVRVDAHQPQLLPRSLDHR